jgi:hypothetical protein
MDPRDMATFIDVWEERDAVLRRGTASWATSES